MSCNVEKSVLSTVKKHGNGAFSINFPDKLIDRVINMQHTSYLSSQEAYRPCVCNMLQKTKTGHKTFPPQVLPLLQLPATSSIGIRMTNLSRTTVGNLMLE